MVASGQRSLNKTVENPALAPVDNVEILSLETVLE